MWNNIEESSDYKSEKGLYLSHLLEQYKLYVEMIDRVSSRRNLANVFFLTLNTTMLGAIGFVFEKIELIQPNWLILFPLLSLLVMNLIWWWLVKSYRDLNTAKYSILRKLSTKLPSSPWSAEWIELGEGNNIKKYLPLTKLEMYIPMIFSLIYILVSIHTIFFAK
ncbi:hypothetical protein [Nonlabens sp. Asnod2-A12]|uniref:RipA family octameric membrane protein n=1 Tax=Nonlabens sp. Asnod2-A12 TaxID=3160578 RepID=UPI003867488E